MATTGSKSTNRPTDGGGFAGDVADALLLPVRVADRVLPDRELPVYLAAGALAAVGVLEWPVALAGGLGYAALRRWQRGRRS